MVVDVEKRLPATRDTEVIQNLNTAPVSQNDLLGCSRYVGPNVKHYRKSSQLNPNQLDHQDFPI